MRDIADAERFRHVGDVLAFGQPVGHAGVGLLAFSTRNRDRERGPLPPDNRQYLPAALALEPADVVLLDHAPQTYRSDAVIRVIRIYHPLHRRPDRFVHDTRRGRILLNTEVELEFHRGKSFGDARRLLGEIAERVVRFPPEQSSRVSNKRRPLRTAEQLLHRNAKMLALDVSQRDIGFFNNPATPSDCG